MRASLLLSAAVLLSACEAGNPFEAAPVHTATFSVRYNVEGTYRACSVTYLDATRTLQREDVAPGWEKTVAVSVRTDQAPFDAFVQATCADDAKVGKVTVSLHANGTLVDTNSTANYGATARAAGQFTGGGVVRRPE